MSKDGGLRTRPHRRQCPLRKAGRSRELGPWVSKGQPTGDAFFQFLLPIVVLPQALGKASQRQGSRCGGRSVGPVSLWDTPRH